VVSLPIPSPPTAICACPGDLNESGAVDGGDIRPFVDMYLGSTAVSNCADLAEPHDASLNTADVAAFAETLMNGLPCQ